MSVFAANFTMVQSSDGLTLSFADTSNYITNDQGYLVGSFSSRQLVLLDANGAAITTINLGASLTADYAITADVWVNATLNLTGINPVPNYTKNLLFPFDRITKNLYRKALKGGCCGNPLVDNALSEADRFFRGAETSAPSGDGPGWQDDINSAFAYLNALNN